MKIKYLAIITLLTMLLSINNTSNCISKDTLNNNDIWINNLGEKDIRIKVIDTNIISDKILLNKEYDKYAIITINIDNTSLNCIELSNINYDAYQKNIKLQTFVKSENNECLGFIGKLESGEGKTVKIGIGLENETNPIKLIFQNITALEPQKYEKIIKLKSN